MSWICDYCSTLNDDSVTECFVCETPRSKESIREAKRAEREERSKRINIILYNSTTVTGKVLCFSSIVLFSVIALIILFLKMKNGLLNDTVHVGISMMEKMWGNFRPIFEVNLGAIIDHWIDFPLGDIEKTHDVISLCVKNTVESRVDCITAELFTNERLKYEVLSDKISLLIDSIADAFNFWKEAIVCHFERAWDNISSIWNSGEGIIQKFKDMFLQFKK